MAWTAAASFLLCGFLSLSTGERVDSTECLFQKTTSSVFDFSLTNSHGKKNVNLSRYKGKYLSLNALQEQFPKELVILGIPCNQFGMQEPGANDTEILNGIMYVRPGGGFEPNFSLFKKIDVNGVKEHQLYTYLKALCPPTRTDFVNVDRLFYSPLSINDIRWNFEKFLITRKGLPYKRFDARVEPLDLKEDVKYLLDKKI